MAGEGLTDVGERLSVPPGRGDIIDGKFRVERRLGEGGMGLVLEAVHLKLDERVALKFLKPEALGRPDVVARFAQEARAAVKLKSEHVARVIDVGDHNGLPFMVMEYLEGSDLEELLAAKGPLPVSDAVELVIQACEGVNEAHARGIVHRDVKPANLFIAQSGHGWGTLKVLDFGISKAALTGKISDVDLASNKTTSVMGSPYYMSPEQLRSTKDVDLRTDIWALGVVLFEALTGRTAFEECDDFAQLVVQILERAPRKLTDFLPSAPGGLQAVIDRCLVKDREGRYRSAAELAIALVPFATSRGAAVVASRAAKITRAAGIDPNLRTPWSLPPGPSDSSPSLARTDLTLSPESSPDVRRALAQPERAAPVARRRSPMPFVIGGLVLVAAVALFLRRGTSETPIANDKPPATSVATSAAPAVAAPAVPTTATAPEVTPPPSTTPSASASAATPPDPAQRVRPSTPTTPRRQPPRTVTSSSSPSPDLEIRRER